MKLHDIRKSGIYERIVKSVIISTDDNLLAKEILDNFKILCKMDNNEYKKTEDYELIYKVNKERRTNEQKKKDLYKLRNKQKYSKNISST